MNWQSDLAIAKSLFVRDLYVLKKEFFSEMINLITFPVSQAVTFGYVLPTFGMDKEFGSFLLVGAIATAYFYLAITFGSDLVSDFEALRRIDSQFIVPISSHKVLLLQKVMSFAVHSTALAVPVLPIGKLALPTQLMFVHFSLFKFFLATFSCGLFFGCFGLFLASVFATVHSFGNVWRRVYTPMVLCGGYWFSFKMANQVFGNAAYIMFLNPLTFMSEGIRASVFGPEKYINFWFSMSLLFGYTLVLGWCAFANLKRRLDVL